MNLLTVRRFCSLIYAMGGMMPFVGDRKVRKLWFFFSWFNSSMFVHLKLIRQLFDFEWETYVKVWCERYRMSV